MEASAWGLLGLVVVTDAWALWRILARRGRPLRKAAWTAGVVLLPLLGVAAWLLLGPLTLPVGSPEGSVGSAES